MLDPEKQIRSLNTERERVSGKLTNLDTENALLRAENHGLKNIIRVLENRLSAYMCGPQGMVQAAEFSRFNPHSETTEASDD